MCLIFNMKSSHVDIIFNVCNSKACEVLTAHYVERNESGEFGSKFKKSRVMEATFQ